MNKAEEFLKEQGIVSIDDGSLNYSDGSDYINERILINLLQSYAACQVKEALEQIEKSLMSDVKESIGTSLEQKYFNQGIIAQRNKTQEAINEIKKDDGRTLHRR